MGTAGKVAENPENRSGIDGYTPSPSTGFHDGTAEEKLKICLKGQKIHEGCEPLSRSGRIQPSRLGSRVGQSEARFWFFEV